ncbi:hypothetical protein P7K49_002056 [Saguinus oedipus]|uniref:Uncharacterized protein n=1 Tax=Saguinus oedipus TaxID=9490 RepID=A0ABQ9WGQ9_SAGOE|nr:hypothetical protein P7K49_002056 [Saguinus oedipus]
MDKAYGEAGVEDPACGRSGPSAPWPEPQSSACQVEPGCQHCVRDPALNLTPSQPEQWAQQSQVLRGGVGAQGDQTLQLARQLRDQAVEAQACYSLGNTYTLLQDYERAAEYHLRHLLIAQELADR